MPSGDVHTAAGPGSSVGPGVPTATRVLSPPATDQTRAPWRSGESAARRQVTPSGETQNAASAAPNSLPWNPAATNPPRHVITEVMRSGVAAKAAGDVVLVQVRPSVELHAVPPLPLSP